MSVNQNPAMLCDFYEMTMSRGYFEHGLKDKIAYFDLFFRNVPDGGGFAIAAGLAQLIEYVENLHFSKEDIDFLRAKGGFSEEFLEYRPEEDTFSQTELDEEEDEREEFLEDDEVSDEEI